MKRAYWLTLAIIVIASPLLFGADAHKPSAVVATIAGAAVSEDDVAAAVGNRLMRIRTEEYNIRRAALEEIIANKLLEAEAARRHITLDDLLKTEVDSKASIPAASDIEPFYEGTKDRFGNMPKEEAMQQIADGMHRQKLAQRRSELVRSLRAAAGVKVMLDPPRAQVAAIGPARGNAGAAITIVEFSDFECPFCSKVTSTLHRLQDAYGDKVRIVFRDYPLVGHRGAGRAAEAAHCAEEQGKFWEMHDRLYSKGGGPIAETDIQQFAAAIALDREKFSACLASGRFTETWKTSQAEGAKLGVNSTPTFFVNGRMMSGAAPYEAFAKIIDEELEHPSATAPVAIAARTN